MERYLGQGHKSKVKVTRSKITFYGRFNCLFPSCIYVAAKEATDEYNVGYSKAYMFFCYM